MSSLYMKLKAKLLPVEEFTKTKTKTIVGSIL
jgi:hypothetical protein